MGDAHSLSQGRAKEEKEEQEQEEVVVVVVVVLRRENRGGSAPTQHRAKPRFDESLALWQPYLQQEEAVFTRESITK